jgi:hypothetical protein
MVRRFFPSGRFSKRISSMNTTIEPEPAAIVRELLAELEPTRRPNKKIGPRAVKRLIQEIGGRLGHDFYVSEAEFSTIANSMGFPIEPRPSRAGRPVTSWWLGISKRSLVALERSLGDATSEPLDSGDALQKQSGG